MLLIVLENCQIDDYNICYLAELSWLNLCELNLCNKRINLDGNQITAEGLKKLFINSFPKL